MSPQHRTANLQDQVAVVTGGGRGLGRGIARMLSRAGASLGVLGRSTRELDALVAEIEAAGGRAMCCPADVSEPERVRNALVKIRRDLGPVDLLVNNAGMSGDNGPLWALDEGEIWRVFEVNTRGAIACSHAVLDEMIERGRGRIINVVSDVATRATTRKIAYACSKAAVMRFTECLSELTKGRGVRAFALSPGMVRTEMTEATYRAMQTGIWPAGATPYYVPCEDWRTPDQIGELVVSLAQGAADALSGRYLHATRDDLEVLVRRAAAIEAAELHVLRVAYE